MVQMQISPGGVTWAEDVRYELHGLCSTRQLGSGWFNDEVHSRAAQRSHASFAGSEALSGLA